MFGQHSIRKRTHIWPEKTLNEFRCLIDEFQPNEGVNEAASLAISYAMYRLMDHRFALSPRYLETKHLMDSLMNNLGYDVSFADTDYSTGKQCGIRKLFSANA